MLQQSFGYPYVEKLIGFIFMYDVLGELCILTGALLHFFLTNAKYMYFQWSKVILKWVFSNKVMGFQKGYKISFRMYLNLCNAKFSIIDVENRVYMEVILSLHFSIAFFNMYKLCKTIASIVRHGY